VLHDTFLSRAFAGVSSYTCHYVMMFSKLSGIQQDLIRLQMAYDLFISAKAICHCISNLICTTILHFCKCGVFMHCIWLSTQQSSWTICPSLQKIFSNLLLI